MNRSKFLISIFAIIFLFDSIIAQSASPPPPPPPKPAGVNSLGSGNAPEEKVPANSTVRGRVFYADTGRPVKRSTIMLMSEDGRGGPGGSESGLTDGNGYFEIKKVKAGTYYAMVNAPGVVSPLAYTNLAGLDRGNESEEIIKGFAGFEKIVVDGITDLDTQIPARRGGAIGGRVMYDDGDPAIGVKVEVLRKVEEKFIPVVPNFSAIIAMFAGGSSQTDDRGIYRFSGLPAGEYTVRVTENASHTNSNPGNSYSPEALISGGSSFLSIFFPDVFDAKSAQIINIQMGQEISEANIIIPSRNLFYVAGKVISKKDGSQVKARIGIKRIGEENIVSLFSALIRRSGSGKALTDRDGNWDFKELPKGKYQLTVEPIEDTGEYDIYSGDYSNANRTVNTENNGPPEPKFAKATKEITIEDENLDEVVIELGHGATISGLVSTENNQDLPESIVIKAVNQNEELSVSENISAYSYDDEGDRKAGKKRDLFKLENISVGETSLLITVPETFYVRSAVYKDRDLLAQEFTLSEGEILNNVKIILASDVGTLKGKLLDEDKNPLARKTLTLVPVDLLKRKNPGFYRHLRTDENGEFETKLAPFEYAVVFFVEKEFESDDAKMKWLNEAIRDAKKIKIESGKTETATIINS